MAKKNATQSKHSEATQPFHAERFECSVLELATLFGRLHLQPISGSPLINIMPLDDSTDANQEIPYWQREALVRLACPETQLKLVCCTPPQPAVIATYYGVERDGDFVLYEQHIGGMHRLAYPVDAFSLFETGGAALQLQRPAETSGFTLVMDHAAFQTMAGIVDLIQEHTLKRMLERKLPATELEFTAEDIAACCARSQETLDNRWMVPRALLASPLQLSFCKIDIQQGLEWLTDAGALRKDGKQFGLTSVFSLVCSRLISCTGLFAVSTHRRQSNGHDWLHEHFAGLRCSGCLWQLEFFDISASDFKVTLLDVTSHMLYGRLTAALFPTQTDYPDTSQQPSTEQAKQKHCPQCNAVLKAGKKFCTQCGAAIAN